MLQRRAKMAAPARTVRTGKRERPVRPEAQEAPAVREARVARPAQAVPAARVVQAPRVVRVVVEETAAPAAVADGPANDDGARLPVAPYWLMRVQSWVSPNIGEPT
jgi:hypothetical protein